MLPLLQSLPASCGKWNDSSTKDTADSHIDVFVAVRVSGLGRIPLAERIVVVVELSVVFRGHCLDSTLVEKAFSDIPGLSLEGQKRRSRQLKRTTRHPKLQKKAQKHAQRKTTTPRSRLLGHTRCRSFSARADSVQKAFRT